MWRSKHTGFAQSILYKVLLFSLLLCGGGKELCAQFYPIHAVVQWPSPQSPHLVDYYSGSRDRLIITLHNRDLQQPLLLARLRLQIKSNGFLAQTREELSYPQLELMAGVPTRLTATDLMPYLRPESLLINGRLRNGQFPTGFTEISVQVVDYYSQQVLSSWHTARAYLDSKQPPMLNLPQRDEQVGYRDPLFIRFQWYPRHQGLAGTEYEFVLKELPDNGAAPQAAFAYGNEIYRTRTRHTTLNYTHLEPILLPNRRYAWQVQAIARDGVDELGLFEHGGFSEIYWFTLNENCPVPTELKADPRYAKVDFSWNRVVGATGYMLACRPKTSKDIYEWSEVQSYGERMTLAQLKPGWTYEWRVGTLCTGDKPIYSAIQEVTLPKSNVDLLRDCGKEPPRPNLSPDPALDIQVGDTVTIGGDYPMVITQLQRLGDGWYSGRGTTRLSSIIELPRVALRFDRLRINIEKCQIDGLVEAIYADQPGGIADLDKIDDGGKRVQPSKLRIRERKVDFALGDMPEMSFDPETGELEVIDAEGKPQRIKLDLPEGGASASAFPMIITDSKGDSYQLSPDESSEVSSSGASSGTSSTEGRVGTKQGLKVERVERIGSFDASRLAHGIGTVRFEPSAQARYAFDSGTESWYQRSVKLDEYYKPFAKGYIAPWKLVPVGEQDVVAARYEGKKSIDLSRVRFATSPNSPALPAELHEESKTWSLKLLGTDAQSSYDVFAIYEGQVIGKLRVVSYPKQRHKLTLVPVNEAKLDKEQIERELNSIYDSVGIHFDVEVDARMRGNYSWDRDGDGKLSVVGKSFFGRVREVKESAEMEYLKKAYTQLAGTLDGVYLFVVDAAGGLEAQPKDLLGEMPRRSRFGYIFSGNSPNGGVSALSHTIAHELGHGLFTLQHTFDDEYGGTESQGQTRNLMDYTTGKELAAFQWNVLANPAVFTAADKIEESKLKDVDVREFLRNIRLYLGTHGKLSVSRTHRGSIHPRMEFFNYSLAQVAHLYCVRDTIIEVNRNTILKASRYLSAYSAVAHQIIVSEAIVINCLSEGDRDVIYNFLLSEASPILDSSTQSLGEKSYSYSIMYYTLENIKRSLINKGKYALLRDRDRLILDLPLIMWKKGWKYAAIFMYNWIVGGGDVYADDKLFSFIDKWGDLKRKESDFKAFIRENMNRNILDVKETGELRLYTLSDLRAKISKSPYITLYEGSDSNLLLTNFSAYSIRPSAMGNPNSPYIASFGTFTKRFAFTGKVVRNNKIIVDEVWEYFNDGFDFSDSDNLISQPLGNWNKSIFQSIDDVDIYPTLFGDGKLYLQNKDFNAFRIRTGLGKDFRIKGKRVHSDKFLKSIILRKDGVLYQ